MSTWTVERRFNGRLSLSCTHSWRNGLSDSALLLTFREELDNVIEAVTLALFQAGLRVACSFDVEDSACAALSQPCPHHGTTPCAYRLAILSVFDDGPPIALAVHGNGDQAPFSLAKPSLSASSQQEEIVARVLSNLEMA